MRWASVILLLGGCDRVFGLFPVVSPDLSVDSSTVDVPPPPACPADYTVTLMPSVSTSKYRIDPETQQTWVDSADLCEMDSKVDGSFTHLVVLSNDGERAALTPMLDRNHLWIGYSDIVADNQFRWVTDESTGTYPAPQQPPWDGDDPDRVGAGCVALRDDSPQESPGLIGDEDCTNALGVICECDGFKDQHRR